MTDNQAYHEASARLEALAEEIYRSMAAQFPVCLSSDEFHFFPQFKSTGRDGPTWDDFSDRAVQSFLAQSSQWRSQLEALRPRTSTSSVTVSIDLLVRVLTSVEEQLDLVKGHKTQPTFHLTILSIGLAESMDDDYETFGRRTRHLPQFLEAAAGCLDAVPDVFRDLALEMIPKVTSWMTMLPMTAGEQRAAREALDKFGGFLARLECRSDFRLTDDLYARIADFHMGCQMGLDEIEWHLDNEISTADHDLAAAAVRIRPGESWLEVFNALPVPEIRGNDAAAHFRGGIDQLREHCLDNGFTESETLSGSDVTIQTIPEHMIPIRANAAYSMPPGHPPRGGIFYILPLSHQSLSRDMMLLAAHETYPGHHLLDTTRWRLAEPLRRCLEFPLFYEGWASFGEEILFDTEFFSGPADQLMMAKRRYWRALRGRAEVRIHTGRCSLEEAASELADAGLVTLDQALAMVRRYALKPGYQLAYAIGRRKFRQLYTAYLGQGKAPAQFVRDALAQGEIGFDHLAEHMLYTT